VTEALESLRSAGPDRRASAAVSLAKSSGAPAVRSALVEALRNDPDPVVRTKIVYALGTRADPALSETLRRALIDDRDARVRHKAAWALGKTKDPDVLIDLRDVARREREVEAVRREAIVALAALGGEDAARALVDIVLTPSTTAYLCDQAIQQLAGMGSVAVEPMIDAMRDLGQPYGEFADSLIERHGGAAANLAARELRRRLAAQQGV
jgi:HEAT repeat protein